MSLAAVTALLAMTIACGKESSPLAPSAGAAPGAADAAPDGSTLKVTAPVPRSPINGQRPTELPLTFVAGNAQPTFVTELALTYRFEILTAAGVKVYEAGGVAAGAGGATAVAIPDNVALEPEATYQWRVRAEHQGLAGPWSAAATFVAPVFKGYLRGAELYDPLINRETVGTTHGPVTFIPGVGIKLETQLSYVHYVLPQTLTEGEFSILATNIHTNTEGHKRKMFSMAQGFDDIVTNERRMTVEKRGNPPGIIAWRFITHGDQVDTIGNEREVREFNPALDYFWQATWRNNFFNLIIKEGGVHGTVIYDKGKHFEGRAYDPNPHVVFLGAPVGRSGLEGASVDGVIIRQVWVSGNPRPSFASR